MAIAENHLSELANKGRYGDTELVHVNKREKEALEAMGGSGTINPETGLKEYFLPALAPFLPAIMAGAAVAGVGVAGYSAYGRGREKELQAANQYNLLGEQRDEVLESMGALEETATAQKEVAVKEFEAAGEDLGESFTQSMDKLETVAGSTGLVQSAGVKKAELGALDQLEGKTEDLVAGVHKTVSGIETDYQSQLANYQSKLTEIDYKRQLADRQKGQWYLGKNVGKMFRGEGRFKGLGSTLLGLGAGFAVGWGAPAALAANYIGRGRKFSKFGQV